MVARALRSYWPLNNRCSHNHVTLCRHRALPCDVCCALHTHSVKLFRMAIDQTESSLRQPSKEHRNHKRKSNAKVCEYGWLAGCGFVCAFFFFSLDALLHINYFIASKNLLFIRKLAWQGSDFDYHLAGTYPWAESVWWSSSWISAAEKLTNWWNEMKWIGIPVVANTTTKPYKYRQQPRSQCASNIQTVYRLRCGCSLWS